MRNNWSCQEPGTHTEQEGMENLLIELPFFPPPHLILKEYRSLNLLQLE